MAGHIRPAVSMDEESQFDAYYAEIFGARWPSLRASLREAGPVVRRPNIFAGEPASGEGRRAHPGLPGCFYNDPPAPPRRTASGVLDVYLMDPGSVLAAGSLGVARDDRVLDLCAAPGGKGLILAEAVGESGRLVLNEPSRRRRFKLMQVLRDYLPERVRERVEVAGRDGAKWGVRDPGAFDRVLADVPCSGERHLLGDRGEMRRWTPARTRQLARRQYALLASAWLALRPGGRLVYATCSISPLENDAVVGRLVRRKEAEGIRPICPSLAFGESTALGWQVLPDRHEGGPTYFAILEKQR